MTTTARPTVWAETMLRLSLKQADREAVSGDLLEEYRSSIVPARGQASANVWYLRQVAGFLWRATWPWALVFSGQFIARTAYDWAVPTSDFHLRAEFPTEVGLATLLLVALWASWRSGSL